MTFLVSLFSWLFVGLAVPYALILGANWLLPIDIEYTWRSIGAVWWLIGCGVFLHAANHKNAQLQARMRGDDAD